MPDYYGGVAQAGAQMMNSGLNAMTAQKKMDLEREMESQKIAAAERMQAARMSAAGGGQFGGKDPASNSVRSFQGVSGVMNSYTDTQFDLMGMKSAKEKEIEGRGYGTEEDLLAMRKLEARIANNDFAMKTMLKSLNSGKFEYNTTDADGSTVKAVFDSAADLEMYKSTFKGSGQEVKEEKAKSITDRIRENALRYQGGSSEPQSSGSSVVPVAKPKQISMDDQINSKMQESGIEEAEPAKNPAATGGGGRRGRTSEDAVNETKMKIESLKKQFESLKGQKNSRGNQNTAAMRSLAGKSIEEENKLKSGN